MKSMVAPAVVALAALLSACTGTQPPAADPFFANQEPFGGDPPSDARTVTPEEFKRAAQQEGFTWDSLKRRQERAEAARAQFALDEAGIKRLATASRGYRRALQPPPADGSVEVLDDGNYLVTVQGRNGPAQVVTEGPRSYFGDLLASRKRFEDAGNQVRVYRYGFDALPDALRTGLPTLDSLSGATLETVLNARRELAKRLEANPNAISDAKIVPGGVRAQGVNPDAKPPDYPANPSLEEGFGEGSDRDQSCAGVEPDSAGLYKNFWWKQKFYATSVKDQARRGACAGFALTAAAESRIAIEKGRWVNLSEQRLWFQMAGIWQYRWYGDGANLVNRAEDFHEQGFQLPFEKTWNYNPSESRVANKSSQTYSKSCESYDEFCSNSSFQGEYICTGPYCAYFPAPATGERFKESEPDVLFDFWDDAFGVPVSEMRLLLKQGHPMTASFIVDGSYKNVSSQGYVTNPSDPVLNADGNVGRHANQIVGFISDADIQAHPALPASVKQKSSQSEGGYFILKNSWGQCSGDNGYYYVSVKWAKEYFTSVVAFDVKPSNQFKQVPNVPPTVSITAPTNGLSFPYRQKITLKATAVDPDGSATPTVTWASDKDGLLGTGAQLEASFSFPGTRTVTAVAADGKGGYSPAASVTITGVNQNPDANIISPNTNSTFYVNDPVPFDGEGLDGDGTFPTELPCSSLSWKSSNASDPSPLFTGCEKNNVVFTTTGARTVTLTATDANGGQGTDTVTVNIVVKPPSGPPTVIITAPKAGASYGASSQIKLADTLSDPGGTPKSQYARVWTLKAGGLPEKIITPKSCLSSGGRPFTCFVPADYGINDNGVKISDLSLAVTDPEGLTGTGKVTINIGQVP
jgi:C1A family cysteine protease